MILPKRIWKNIEGYEVEIIEYLEYWKEERKKA